MFFFIFRSWIYTELAVRTTSEHVAPSTSQVAPPLDISCRQSQHPPSCVSATQASASVMHGNVELVDMLLVVVALLLLPLLLLMPPLVLLVWSSSWLS